MKTLLITLAFTLGLSLNACEACKAGNAAAIPGSSAMRFEGFGAGTKGGHGGRVIKVTTLAAEGEGSLRAALEAKGPRIVVFEVGGVIDWRMEGFSVKNGRLTIAGETAPSPGISIIRGSLNISAPDVIVRHIRVRSGDGADLRKSNFEIDSITANGPGAHDILFEHCSTAWSIDENLSVSGPRVKNGTAARVTLRNCIIAEAIDNSTHPKGPHSKGTLIHDFVRDVAIVGCFYTHNFNRHPYIKPNASVYMANNLINNPGNAAIHFAYTPNEYKTIPDPMLPSILTAIGNVYRMGPDTKARVPLIYCTPNAPDNGSIGSYYERDSIVYGKDGSLLWSEAAAAMSDKAWLADPRLTRISTPLVAPKNFTPLPAAKTEAYVLKNAGARPRDRDSVDTRVIADYQTRKGRIIDSQEEVGGYPRPAPATRKLDIPAGGPDAIEAWLAAYRAEVESP